MSVYSDPETHAANPPETWVVVKVSERNWHLRDRQGATLERGTTKRECECAREVGFIRNLYDDETRWYAGATVSTRHLTAVGSMRKRSATSERD